MPTLRKLIFSFAPVLLATAVAANAQTGDTPPNTGIEVKKPVFGGACKLCPWGAMAEIVKEAMKPYSFDVQICYNCNRADSPRIVAEARMPPPYEKDQAVSVAQAPRNAPGLGPVDFGATAVRFFRHAYRGVGIYANEEPHKNLRLIAKIQSPYYLIVAATAASGITDLSQIRDRRRPVRILMGHGEAQEVLSYYGLTREMIEESGGYVGSSREARQDFDVIIHGAGGLSTAPEWDVWYEVTQRFELHYIELPEQLLAKLAKEQELERGYIPNGLFRGVERAIPTVIRGGTVIYGRDDMPDDFAYIVAKAMDEQQHLLQYSNQFFSYNVHNVWEAYEVPLHPGAARYYREKGYMK